MTQTPQERAGLMVRRAMDRSGLSAAEIARRAKIGKATLSNAARRGHMRVDTMFRIIEACGLEIVELRVRSLVRNTKESNELPLKAWENNQ